MSCLHLVIKSLCLTGLVLWQTPSGLAQPDPAANHSIDILHYEAQITPDLAGKELEGEVTIQVRLAGRAVGAIPELILNCGDLIIERVSTQKNELRFEKKDRRLHIALGQAKRKQKLKITIRYHGEIRRGVQLFPEARQLYTVFSTSHWMPCRNAPSDRAGFDLQLIVPTGLAAVGNGKLRSKKAWGEEQVMYHWRMKKDAPTYCFGFAVGPMNLFIERQHGVRFQYLSADYSEAALQRIFETSPQMLRFFERKAGVRYPGRTYTQILPKGSTSQEMSDFTVMRNNYGQQVLEDPSAIQLSGHELAHQWWGNQVTCRNWNHFWLNEGMAVFMSAVYREYRFGRESYLEDMDLYREAYQRVAEQGLDKPLQFPDWDQPTAQDRTLVYYKGAYFLHLLREELGERIFWKGIRRYTKKYFGRSVVSSDLQFVMEKVSRKDLSRLFDEWVYPREKSTKN